jgi:hypothetical protein
LFFNILYKWNCQIIFVLSIYSKTYIKRSPLDINTTKLLKQNHTHKLDIAQKGGWHFSNWSVSNTDDSFLIFLTVVWEITLFFSLTWELSLQTYMIQKKNNKLLTSINYRLLETSFLNFILFKSHLTTFFWFTIGGFGFVSHHFQQLLLTIRHIGRGKSGQL